MVGTVPLCRYWSRLRDRPPPRWPISASRSENLTAGQPITPPVVVVHDPNVDVFEYTSPDELDGIDDLAEGGVQADLGDHAQHDARRGLGLRSRQRRADRSRRDIHGGQALRCRGSFDVTLVGMFACTNDAYIRVTNGLDVGWAGCCHSADRSTALVFDSGSETNDETMATIPCLGGPEAALSEGLGEGTRSPHAGIVGNADLSKETHGWTDSEGTARMTLFAAEVDEMPEPAPPATGDMAPGGVVLLAMGVGGLVLVVVGEGFILLSRRRRNEVIK